MAILTPINEVNSKVVRVNIPLPEYAHPEKIGVNVELVEGLCRLSGIRRLSVGTFSESDQLSTIAQNIGGDVETALGIKSKTAPRIRSEKSGDNQTLPKYCQWSEAHVDFNTQKVQEDILGMKGGVHEQSNWISLLNEYVRKGVTRVCLQNLMRLNAGDMIIDVGMITHVITGAMSSHAGDLTLLLNLPIVKGLASVIHKRANDMAPIPLNMRPTCSIFGLEIDRAIALAVRSLRHRNDFVKEIKDEECE